MDYSCIRSRLDLDKNKAEPPKKPSDEIFTKPKNGGAGGGGASAKLKAEEAQRQELEKDSEDNYKKNDKVKDPEPPPKPVVVLSHPKWDGEQGCFNQKITASVEGLIPPEISHVTRTTFTAYALPPDGKPDRIDTQEGHIKDGTAQVELTLWSPDYKRPNGDSLDTCEYIFKVKHRDSKEITSETLTVKKKKTFLKGDATHRVLPNAMAKISRAKDETDANFRIHCDAIAHVSMTAPTLDGMSQGELSGSHNVTADRSGMHGKDLGLGDLVHTGRNEDRPNSSQSVGRFGGAQQERYGDTFGAGRMGDNAEMNGALAKLGGNRRSGESDQRGDTSQADGPTGTVKTPDGSAAPNPIAFPGEQTTGGSQIASSHGNDAGATRGETAGATMPRRAAAETWQEDGNGGSTDFVIKPGTRMPTEDQDAGGSGAPVVVNAAQSGAAQNALHRELAGHRNVTDGPGDGRAETGSSAGGTGAIGVAQRDKVDGNVEHEQGTLDLDKALEINQLVNPTRT